MTLLNYLHYFSFYSNLHMLIPQWASFPLSVIEVCTSLALYKAVCKGQPTSARYARLFCLTPPGLGLTSCLTSRVLDNIQHIFPWVCRKDQVPGEEQTFKKQPGRDGLGRYLDGVGPVDNRPSTDKLHHFVREKKKKSDMWHVTRDMWHVLRDTWHVWGGEHSLKISAP